ncbi:PP2C family protein-serine/threonine phosphatase [Tessaracoccus caeni]|uniref:PP2C family protein-serine/threonine phosphatase n=1 Tax=Tessaracoccus caeni TaxID=3031239 RepID=UPI0023DB357C|nr:protein phosphatase 2C domain-containing protein [Tessaracoccus caeni]MDF1487253.1 protein phosphatase 2C domain-containing protein [Tessaracoccus caeni]
MVAAERSSAPYSIRALAHSEVGRIRKNNQDSGYASPTMLLVCDGMGGAAAGDLASAVAAVEASRSDRRIAGAEDMLSAMSGIISRTNARLGDLIDDDHALDGMGTTFCGGMFNGSQLAIAHVGDSRGYLLRDGELTQITHDHSWVQQLIDEGRITPEQAATHPHRSLILKVLNGQMDADPDLIVMDVRPGDRFLFCSDGLSGLIDDASIATLLAIPDVAVAVEFLAHAAYEAGGHDNITVVVGEVVEHDDDLERAAPILVGSATEVTIPRVGISPGPSNADGHDSTYPTPPAQTGELPPDEVARYAPREAKRRWPGTLAAILVVALVLGGSAWGAVAFTRTRYFVAVHDGNVAIYNGLPGTVLGYELNTLVEDTDIAVADLPRYYQRDVNNTIAVDDLAAAQVTAGELRMRAEQCVATRLARSNPQPSPSPTASRTVPQLPYATGAPAQPATSSPESAVPYPTNLAPLTPAASSEADPEAC